MGDPNAYGPAQRWKPRDIPVYDEWKSKIGKIYDMWVQPCDPDAWVMIQAWVVNIPYFAWAITKPDPNDLVAMRGGLPHKRRRRGRFSITDLLMPVGNPQAGFQRVMYKITSAAQRVGYWYMFIDATLDFQINWVSTAYQWAGCNTPNNWNGAVWLPRKGYTNAGQSGFMSTVWQEEYSHNAFCGLEGIASTEPSSDCTAMLTFQTSPAEGWQYAPPRRVWLRTNQVGGEVDYQEAGIYAREGGGHSYNASSNLGPRPTRNWTVTALMEQQSSGAFIMENARMFAQATNAPSILKDP